jgi:hypothetical protein
LYLIILYTFLIAVRYFWYINIQILYNILLIGGTLIQSGTIFLICYFFTKKAAHYLDEKEKMRKNLLILMGVSALLYAGVIVYQIVETSTYIKDADEGLCHTFYFLVPEFINLAIITVFFFVGHKITQTINLYNQH